MTQLKITVVDILTLSTVESSSLIPLTIEKVNFMPKNYFSTHGEDMNTERIDLENKESAQFLFSLKMDENKARRQIFHILYFKQI